MIIFIDLKRVGLLGVKIYRPDITSEITALASVVEDAKKTWNIQVCMYFILHFRILVVLKKYSVCIIRFSYIFVKEVLSWN